jgi:hypothetical protein
VVRALLEMEKGAMNTWRPPLLPKNIAEGFTVTDAPVAAAIAQCWLARNPNMPIRVGIDHQSCSWCDYPLDELMGALCRFWTLPDVEDEEARFRTLAPKVQRRLVEEAR